MTRFCCRDFPGPPLTRDGTLLTPRRGRGSLRGEFPQGRGFFGSYTPTEMGRPDELAKLAAIAAIPRHASLEDLMAACEMVRGALGADEVYVIQAADPHFAKLGAA